MKTKLPSVFVGIFGLCALASIVVAASSSASPAPVHPVADIEAEAEEAEAEAVSEAPQTASKPQASLASPPPNTPTEWDVLSDQTRAFLAIDMVPDLEGSATREEEDAAAVDALRRKSAAMVAVTEGLVAALSEQPEAYLMLADVYMDMGDALVQMPQPAYLNAEQTHQYDLAIRAKAQRQYDQAWEVLERAESALPADHPVVARLPVAFEQLRAR